MKFEVAWYRGSNGFYVVVDSKNKALNLAENKLSEKGVDEVQIIKKESEK